MSLEKEIIKERAKAGKLLEEVARNLVKEYNSVIKVVKKIVVSLRAHPERDYKLPNRKAALMTIFNLLDDAINECEKERQLGKSISYDQLAEDLKELTGRLKNYRSTLQGALIDTKDRAISSFLNSVTKPFNKVLVDFRNKVKEDKELAKKLNI